MGISVTKTKIHILHAIVFVYNFGLQESQSYIITTLLSCFFSFHILLLALN